MRYLSIPTTICAGLVLSTSLIAASGCNKSVAHAVEEHGEGERKIVVTTPAVQDVITTEQYVCQIHSCRHIEVCALESGYLEEVQVKEGQTVRQGDLLFKIVPTLYQARLDTELAEAQLSQIEFNNTKKLFDDRVVSDQEVALAQAKLAKANAKLKLAQSELNFTDIKAPFDGIVDRLHEQKGSLVEEGEMLTSLSDNSVMWVYFNVPESRYLEYQAGVGRGRDDLNIELELANGQIFPQTGAIGAIEADFDHETGNIAFRADFPNPTGLLRHGQTGNVLIHNTLHDALVIPQRATFEILDKTFVFVVGEDNVVHQREIELQYELEDIYVVGDGIEEGDKIVLEGVRQVRDGDAVAFEFRAPEVALSQLKHKAE